MLIVIGVVTKKEFFGVLSPVCGHFEVGNAQGGPEKRWGVD